MERQASSRDDLRKATERAALDGCQHELGRNFLARVAAAVGPNRQNPLFSNTPRLDGPSFAGGPPLKEKEGKFVRVYNRAAAAGYAVEACLDRAAHSLFQSSLDTGSRAMDHHHHENERDANKQRAHRSRTRRAVEDVLERNHVAGAWARITGESAPARMLQRTGIDDGPEI